MTTTLLFLDTETTGLKNPRPYEIGVVATDENGNILGEFSQFIKQDKKLFEEKAWDMLLNYHSEAQVETWATPSEAINNLAEFLKQFGSDVEVIAHNASYDIEVLKNLLSDEGRTWDIFYSKKNNTGFLPFSWVCTMYTLRTLRVLNKWIFDRCTLDMVRAYFNIDDDAHTALDDARLVKKLWFDLIQSSIN